MAEPRAEMIDDASHAKRDPAGLEARENVEARRRRRGIAAHGVVAGAREGRPPEAPSGRDSATT